jgi:hypothetical protein
VFLDISFSRLYLAQLSEKEAFPDRDAQGSVATPQSDPLNEKLGM